MIGTTDYVIMIGELIQKWLPDLDWDEVMEIVTSDNQLSRRATRMIQKAIKEGKV